MGKNEPLERYTARVKLSRVDLQSQISHAWVVFFFFLTSLPPQIISIINFPQISWQLKLNREKSYVLA